VAFVLPRTLVLPSGARVTLQRRMAPCIRPSEPSETQKEALFAKAIASTERNVEILEDGAARNVFDLPLADFHVLRGVLTKAGLLEEEAVDMACRNCGARIVVTPCRHLETGPWVDGEADDDELDRTAPFGEPLAIDPLTLGRVRTISSITLAPRTLREALPLHEALAGDRFTLGPSVIDAMGIEALGPITGKNRIARALASIDRTKRAVVTDLFLEAHYPQRLGADISCASCNAKNRFNAPADREFQLSVLEPIGRGGRAPLPDFDTFAERARAIAEPLLADIPGERVCVVIEGETPLVDDGGEPLLGSYVPPPPHDALVPIEPPTVTVYYQTFAKIQAEEGRFDWEAELEETIEHELEHHIYWLEGSDPMDEEERAEIDREALRRIGRGESRRRTLTSFGESLSDFIRRAWPLLLIIAIAALLWLMQANSAD
jgi:hypothetical protein